MRAFPREVPCGVPMFVRLGLVERADQVAAAASRVAVFQIHPDPPALYRLVTAHATKPAHQH